MDLELFAWRRFAKALPLVAGPLLLCFPAVRDWLSAELLSAAMRRAAWFSDVALQPMLDGVLDRFRDSLQDDGPAGPT